MWYISDPYGVCPQGWDERPGSDECYLFTGREAKPYEEARRTCLLEQGDLLVVDDVQEQVDIHHCFINIDVNWMCIFVFIMKMYL